MSRQNYTLEVISHHPTFKNKSLRKYYVEGIETIGAWGDEPFEIRFTNHTWQKVQVKLSVDGTDVLSGDPATTDATPKMWVVNGYGTLSLKAWPENNNGGAQFVFTSGNNSVAAHTHGDMSSRGIIAAAVYTEGHVEPLRYDPIIIGDIYYGGGYSGGYKGTYGGSYGVVRRRAAPDLRTHTTCNSVVPAASSLSDSVTSDSISFNANLDEGTLKSLESLVAVGAGQHVDQKISYVQGLIKPTFSETIRVKYMWWDDLVAKLRQHNVAMPHPSGFPADNQKNINLGKTPRVGYAGQAFPVEKKAEAYQTYLRV